MKRALKPSKYTVDAAESAVRRLLEPGDTVLEIGAADGAHSALYAARVGPSGCVVAVEPHPDHVACLQARQDAYPWLRVLPVAVGAVDGESVLFAHARRPMCSSLYDGNICQTDGTSYQVQVMTVDAIVATMPTAPSLIHLDAQGAEGEILRGARRTLRLPITWVVEVWPTGLVNGGSSAVELFETFRTHGYVPETVRGEAWPWSDLHAAAARRQGGGYCDVVMVAA